MPPVAMLEQGADPEARLAHLAYHDPLTGLPNRACLTEGLEAALGRAGDPGVVVLLSIDLDDFKLVNDGLGHAAGDEMLRQLARRLDAVRRPGDLLARQGGDEFLLVVELPEASDAAAIAARLGERIAEVLEPAFTVADAELRIAASIGAALYPRDAADAEMLHRRAEAAMYQAKESGGGFACYCPGAGDPLERLSMGAALRRGLHEDQLTMHYQPIFRLPGQEMIGVEALIRWRGPDGGFISPAEFIPVAEKTGVIHVLGEWVLRDVCRQARMWEDEGLTPHIGINVSPRQLQRPSFPAEVAAIVAEWDVDPARIVLELTETAWMADAPRVTQGLQRLTAAGFTLALDDFGAGYSSLARLRRLPVSVIKIDRQFMADLPGDSQAAAIVEAILALATACECDVVCEGVETEPQLTFLATRGCRLVQGFGLARPGPVDVVSELMRARLDDSRRQRR